MNLISVSSFDQVTLFSDLHVNQSLSYTYTVILLSLHPAFLMYKNSHRHKIIQWMRTIGRKDQSIDLKIFL